MGTCRSCRHGAGAIPDGISYRNTDAKNTATSPSSRALLKHDGQSATRDDAGEVTVVSSRRNSCSPRTVTSNTLPSSRSQSTLNAPHSEFYQSPACASVYGDSPPDHPLRQYDPRTPTPDGYCKRSPSSPSTDVLVHPNRNRNNNRNGMNGINGVNPSNLGYRSNPKSMAQTDDIFNNQTDTINTVTTLGFGDLGGISSDNEQTANLSDYGRSNVPKPTLESMKYPADSLASSLQHDHAGSSSADDITEHELADSGDEPSGRSCNEREHRSTKSKDTDTLPMDPMDTMDDIGGIDNDGIDEDDDGVQQHGVETNGKRKVVVVSCDVTDEADIAANSDQKNSGLETLEKLENVQNVESHNEHLDCLHASTHSAASSRASSRSPPPPDPLPSLNGALQDSLIRSVSNYSTYSAILNTVSPSTRSHIVQQLQDLPSTPATPTPTTPAWGSPGDPTKGYLLRQHSGISPKSVISNSKSNVHSVDTAQNAAYWTRHSPRRAHSNRSNHSNHSNHSNRTIQSIHSNPSNRSNHSNRTIHSNPSNQSQRVNQPSKSIATPSTCNTVIVHDEHDHEVPSTAFKFTNSTITKGANHQISSDSVESLETDGAKPISNAPTIETIENVQTAENTISPTESELTPSPTSVPTPKPMTVSSNVVESQNVSEPVSEQTNTTKIATGTESEIDHKSQRKPGDVLHQWVRAQKEIKRGQQPQICKDHGVIIKNVVVLAHGRKPSTASDFQNMLNAQMVGFSLSFEPLEEGSDDEDGTPSAPQEYIDQGVMMEELPTTELYAVKTEELYNRKMLFESFDHDRNVIHCVEGADRRSSITRRMEVPLDGMDEVKVIQIKRQIEEAQAAHKELRIMVKEDREDERYATFVDMEAGWTLE